MSSFYLRPSLLPVPESVSFFGFGKCFSYDYFKYIFDPLLSLFSFWIPYYVWVSEWKSLSHVWLFATPWRIPCQPLLSMEFSSRNTDVGCYSPLQGIFLTQGLNLYLLHCRQTLYRLRHQGSPSIMYRLTHFILSHRFSILFSFSIPLLFCCSDWMISIILSSRSCICSFVLFIMLLVASWLAYISGIDLLNFDWFLFIVISSLLQWSVFLLIIFLNNFSVCITSFLNLGAISLVMSHYMFFQGICLFFSLRVVSLLFHVIYLFHLYEFRKKQFSLWTWRGVIFW